MISHLVAARVLSGPSAIAGVLSVQLAAAQLVASATLSVLPIEGMGGGVLAPASISAAGRVRLVATASAALDNASLSAAARLSVKGVAAVVTAEASVSFSGRVSIRGLLSQPLAAASIASTALLVTVEVKAFLARQAGVQTKVTVLLPASALAGIGNPQPASRAVAAPVGAPLIAASGSPVGAASASTAIGPRSRSIRLS